MNQRYVLNQFQFLSVLFLRDNQFDVNSYLLLPLILTQDIYGIILIYQLNLFSTLVSQIDR